jgi:hypothetical protein
MLDVIEVLGKKLTDSNGKSDAIQSLQVFIRETVHELIILSL